MGNQQPTGRTRSDTYTRYERDGEDGRYVTLDNPDSHLPSFDERVISSRKEKKEISETLSLDLDRSEK